MMRGAFICYEDGTLEVKQYANEILDYGFNYRRLLGEDDTIASSSWAAIGNVELISPQQSGPVASVFVSGTNGEVVNVVVTTLGRRKVMRFKVSDRQ